MKNKILIILIVCLLIINVLFSLSVLADDDYSPPNMNTKEDVDASDMDSESAEFYLVETTDIVNIYSSNTLSEPIIVYEYVIPDINQCLIKSGELCLYYSNSPKDQENLIEHISNTEN